MIPSDHFVKFYNEIFRYLKSQGPEAVAEYFDTISRHQETHCLELFQTKGLAGMKEYWDKIWFEENCDSEVLEFTGKTYKTISHNCPSLNKVTDNDAGVCSIYCNHCPGWILPIFTKCGFYCVYDLIGMDVPRCMKGIFTDLEEARRYREKALKRHPGHPELVCCNFD